MIEYKNPYPYIARRILKRILPLKIYQSYIGRHEYGSLHIWKELASEVRSTQVILDIGAFQGEYSLMARNTNDKVKIFAFEPNPISRKILIKKTYQKDIIIEERALDQFNGNLPFIINFGISKLIDSDSQNNNTIRVDTITLDSWIIEKNVIPELIKIDTEGNEAKILTGGINCLTEFKPIIICEILNDSAGKNVMKVIPEDYLFFYIEENKGIENRLIISRDNWRNHNWLLIPKIKLHFLEKIRRKNFHVK